ncbi:leucine rich repeat domain protein [Dictyocaulus viviparus]|uniref:Leucine rich repeat domain protein n=1 Tax=Dictyocaulus viviparus TaxID=29172 RepID=A0A0D8XCY4_DICVI|nr:leucine rich repeat domain protein [Dictyocaulus viviparus]
MVNSYIDFSLETSVISTWSSLEVLTLNGNNLTTLDKLENLSNLRLFRLGENPWHCDCRLKWMKQILNEQSSTNIKCMRPVYLQGRILNNVDDSLMKCSGIEKRDTVSCADAHVCPPACSCTETTVDCRDRGLTHVPEWLVELQKARGIETSGARCEAPKRLARKRFASLSREKFRCRGSEVYQTHRADECFIDVDCPAQCICHGTIVDCR